MVNLLLCSAYLLEGGSVTQLSQSQKVFFEENGYLVVENAVSPDQLNGLKRAFNQWVEESRAHDQAWGTTIDGRARFDVEPGHSAESPALRRINAPIEVSDAYCEVMKDSHMVDSVAQLIGPNIKLHHTKINSKLPGAATAVKWHQDFPFTPHSNDDLITALLMVDEVTQENGPLEVLPGSHKGELHSLWHDGVFTGAVDQSIANDCIAQAVTCTGSAGSVCLMHTRLLHGSAPNHSNAPRTLFIAVYSAEDAVPYSPNPVPTEYEGLVVRGERTGKVRSISYQLELPQKPKSASFFDQQAQAAKRDD